MTTELSTWHKKALTKWSNHAIAIGRDTGSVNKPVVEKAWTELYRRVGQRQPKFIYCRSPYEAEMKIDREKTDLWGALYSESPNPIRYLGYYIFKTGGSSDRGRRGASSVSMASSGSSASGFVSVLPYRFIDKLDDKINRNSLDWKNKNATREPFRIIADSLGTMCDNIMRSLSEIEVKAKHFHACFYCQDDIAWIAYYLYFSRYGLMKDKDFEWFELWYQLAKSCGWCYTFENVVLVCEKPLSLSLNGKGQLHKDGAPALAYSDGHAVYALNNVGVPKDIAVTPAEELDPQLIMSPLNIDIQREIINKIGADILLKKLNAKPIDKWTDPNTGKYYELLRLKANDMDRKYLYYEHASIPGYYYAMPVPRDCYKALHARGWILYLINESELKKVSRKREKEIIKRLPKNLS